MSIDKEELTQLLKDNLNVRIVREQKDYPNPENYRLEVLFGVEIIASTSLGSDFRFFERNPTYGMSNKKSPYQLRKIGENCK